MNKKVWRCKNRDFDLHLIIIIIAVIPMVLIQSIKIVELHGHIFEYYDLYNSGKVITLNILLIPVVLILYEKYRLLGTSILTLNSKIYLAFVIWASISALISPYKLNSLFGWPYRLQGAVTYGFYLVVYIFTEYCIDAKNIKKTLHWLLYSASIISIYAVLQFYGIEPLTSLYGEYLDGGVHSTIGNRNFLGSYMCMVGATSIFIYLKDEGKNSKCYFVVSNIVFIGLLVSQTRGAWLGYTGACLLILLLNKHTWQLIKAKVFLLVICMILLTFLLDLTSQGKLSGRLVNSIAEVESMQAGEISSLGSSRMYIYQRSLKIFLENPIFGTGPDNLAYFIDVTQEDAQKYFGRNFIIIDKAHSEYLEYATTMGFPGLLFYIWFVGRIMFKSYKQRLSFSSYQWGIFAGILGYLLQATFNIGSISVMPIYFVFLGMLEKSVFTSTPNAVYKIIA
ncbi:O-antigen ligase family protein [Anaerotalea alkaliphila]|uniref:O-antigen ligase family protein n=1 Tax=Anaerotalea alkaliphila TaxID=2662126 RepID=A0A7X5HX17_9FIRM|nr:O-antigen ligase family protein [Anaerotalea alkaliphila]NDL68233.1 O-antigen ligase family protein [Anaerotalea alkaliphila]